MHFTHSLLALVATTSLASALPNTPPKTKPVDTQEIMNALAGTWTLVNTSRFVHHPAHPTLR